MAVIHHGDLFDVLPTLAPDSIDACVTDPPYGIGFMNHEWDQPTSLHRSSKKGDGSPSRPGLANDRRRGNGALDAGLYDITPKGMGAFERWTETWAREVHRVLKPGAYIVVCGAPRSYHRMACGLEDAGFVVRDQFAWLFGSGFPKNLNLGDGKGTALKPAHEPIALAWKPFRGSITANVERFGTGALNIDACRIEGDVPSVKRWGGSALSCEKQAAEGYRPVGEPYANEEKHLGILSDPHPLGRWPANVILDEEAAAALDEQSGELVSGANPERRNGDKTRNIYGAFKGELCDPARGLDVGGASRFYYVAKPSREERDYGTHDLAPRPRDESRKDGNPGGDNPRNRGLQPRGNFHPTVKPVELMRWLVKLVTPIDGTVLDPFMGSGTTGMACRYELRRFIGIEREADYIAIAERRIAAVAPLFADDRIA